MHRTRTWITTVSAISLTFISVWWIFFIVWRLGFISLLQIIALRADPPPFSQEVVRGATARAFEYATLGSTQTQDIFFTNNELSHLLDVSQIYQPLRMVLGVGALLGFGWLIVVITKHKELVSRIFITARNIQLLVFGLSLFALAIFPDFFTWFHQVFFPQGNWSFPINSILIQIFPEIFWRLLVVAGALGLLIFAGVFHLSAHEMNDD